MLSLSCDLWCQLRRFTAIHNSSPMASWDILKCPSEMYCFMNTVNFVLFHILDSGEVCDFWMQPLSLWIGQWIFDSLDSFKKAESFRNKTPCVDQRCNVSSVALFGPVFAGEILTILCLKCLSLNINLNIAYLFI